MDELLFSVSSRKQGAVVLQQVSVVLPTQNMLLHFLLGFAFLFSLNFLSHVALVFQLLMLPCTSLLTFVSSEQSLSFQA